MSKTLYLYIFFLSSCGAIGIQEVPQIAKSLIYGVDEIQVTEDLYNGIDYSFVKVKIGKNINAIFVLSNISNGIYSWIGPNNERIYTKYGKLIKTSGLNHNITVIGGFVNFSKTKIINNSHYLQLQDPNAFLNVNTSIVFIGSELTNIGLYNKEDVNLFKETFYAESLKWQDSNLYFFSKSTGRIVKTIQRYHPGESQIELTFHYK